MDKYRYLFEKISILTGIGIFIYKNGELQVIKEVSDFNPIKETQGFSEKLMDMANQQEFPVIYQDGHQVLFSCIKKEGTYYLFGPMSLSNMNSVDQHKYYQEYGMRNDMEKRLPVFLFSKALAVVELIAKMVLGKEYNDEDLIKGNHMADYLEEYLVEQLLLQMEEEENEFYHHTYGEEQDLLECVREGCVEDALQYNMRIDTETGRMSKSELVHWKKVVTVAIALCTRAAIEGGISPAEAYQLSDYYIQKSDECKTVSALIACRNHAVRDLTERVRKKRMGQKSSNYIERCKDYVNKHYREKIYLDDMADSLGVSSTYLSRLFSKETGIRLQDYIIQ